MTLSNAQLIFKSKLEFGNPQHIKARDFLIAYNRVTDWITLNPGKPLNCNCANAGVCSICYNQGKVFLNAAKIQTADLEILRDWCDLLDSQ